MEIIFADVTFHEIQTIRRKICCGCKIYDQDCLMLTEQEAWKLHGLKAIEQASHQVLVWKRFMDVLNIIDVETESSFANHLANLQSDPDEDFVNELQELRGKNQELIKTIDDIFNCPEKPLEHYAQCYFSNPPSFKYYVKKKGEAFHSHERNSLKAYLQYMKSKLRNQINKIVEK